MVHVHTVFTLLSYFAFLAAFLSGVLFLIQERQIKRKTMGLLFHRLPALDALDRFNFWSIGIGFGLLSIGTVFGFVGVEMRLGHWWTGNPTEYLTLVLWAAYLVLWLVRLRSTLRGHRVALLSILGFSLAIFTLLGVSHLLPSWHRYL